MKPSPTHVVWHDHQITRADRERLMGHRGSVVWFTGLSGSGKSTVANAVDQLLHQRGHHSMLLDGDNIRHGLNAGPDRLAEAYGADYASRFGLGFAAEDRAENIRRIAAVAQLFCSAGVIALTAFVSPYRQDRDAARAQIERAGRVGDFVEVYVDTPLDVCEERDPKGLYKMARQGKIQGFTGIDDPYEPPHDPQLVLAGGRLPPQQLAEEVLAWLVRHEVIPSR